MQSRPESVFSAPAPDGAGLGDASLAGLLTQLRLFATRNRRLVLLGAFGGAILCGALAMTTEQRFRSSMMIMVDDPMSSPLESSEMAQKDRSAFIDSQLYILTSRDILQAVSDAEGLEQVGEYQAPAPSLAGRIAGLLSSLLGSGEGAELPEGLSPESYALRQLRRNLYVTRHDETNVIGISVSSASPVRSAQLARRIGQEYIANRQRAQIDRARRLGVWLDERVLELGRKLSEAEDAVAAYRIENNLISGDAETTLGEQQLLELNAELIRTRAALSEKRAAHERGLQLLQDEGDIQALPQIQDSDLVTDLRTRLLDLQLREAGLRRTNATDQRIVAVAEERASVQARLNAEIRRVVSMIGHEVETLEAREALVAAALADAGGRSGEESLSSVRLRELERVAQGYQALYQRYISNAGIAEEGLSFLSSGVEVIEQPSIPQTADFPPTRLLIVWGFLLGGALGILAAILREAMQRGFVTSAQLREVLGRPVLSMLDQPARGASLAGTVRQDPGSDRAEAVRGLRLTLTSGAGVGADARHLLLVPACAEDGIADLAAALALSAAQGRKRVLLVDADLRRGSAASAWGVAAGPGLAETLAGRDIPCHYSAALPGVAVLPAGQADAATGDLLTGEAMRGWLARVGAEYDLVVIACPAALGSGDAPILARMVDRAAAVVRWLRTPRDLAAAALARFQPGELQGVIVTGVDAARARDHGEACADVAA